MKDQPTYPSFSADSDYTTRNDNDYKDLNHLQTNQTTLNKPKPCVQNENRSKIEY